VAVCVLWFVLVWVVVLGCVCGGFGVIYYILMGDLMGVLCVDLFVWKISISGKEEMFPDK